MITDNRSYIDEPFTASNEFIKTLSSVIEQNFRIVRMNENILETMIILRRRFTAEQSHELDPEKAGENLGDERQA